ncbi:MAG: xanthine phosphoribosyltransferase [Clostridia bacterium]|nr:xanthine phosphoribosyltransferase [Clostridia bacterium]
MQLLEERIRRDGKVFPGDVLKVDSFLNHQLDAELLDAAGAEIAARFEDCGVTKVLTVESSGIAIACFTARYLHCPALFAKKSKTSNIADGVWSAKAHSYTHGNDYTMVVSKEYLGENDVVLIVDDFLANGCALKALREICEKAGARIAGAGIAIEKEYQGGGNELRAEGLRIESIARIASMDAEDGIRFC